MTVGELREVLSHMKDDESVYICVKEPTGWICPDGAIVGIKGVYNGFDWHMGQVLVVPEHELDVHDVEEWSGRKRKEEFDVPGQPLEEIRLWGRDKDAKEDGDVY